MAKRRTKEQVAQARAAREEAKKRTKDSAWILFLKGGYSLYTACTACGEMETCRGKYRESVKCRACHTSSA
jgi:hypothetical protein